ncbi:hypothetical protein H0H93_012412 [Arthromyces matolae]|nr:hypothetical protein H0H93_012412 [Arthromyces matolae]
MFWSIFSLALIAWHKISVRGQACNTYVVPSISGGFTTRQFIDFSGASSNDGVASVLSSNGISISNYGVTFGPVPHTFTPSNLAFGTGSLDMKVSAYSGSGAVLSSEIVTNDVFLYASVRTVLKSSSVAGIVEGNFFYLNDNQETDWEILTTTALQASPYVTAGIWATNQALIPGQSSTSMTVPFTFDPSQDYHVTGDLLLFPILQWVANATTFFIDGIQKARLTTNVPTEAGHWIWNAWSNGDPTWSNGPPTADSITHIRSIDIYKGYTSTRAGTICDIYVFSNSQAIVMSIRGPRKGENYELSVDLNSEYREKRKDAIKRTIASMTVGKDVSGLFPDVLKNMQTEDLEQKKLVYLYLMNYAKTQPELVILAVNTFVKDTEDPNPLVRALAIRTMGCLRAEKIIDYLCDPLQKCLRDENPYVRKTAALCVAKLYDLKPELVLDNGFLEQLHEMIADSNPMVSWFFLDHELCVFKTCEIGKVVANTVAALTDIHNAAVSLPSTSSSDPAIFTITTSILNKLLIALNECSEWGRVAVLNALARYDAKDDKESEHICERVVPQFQHINGSVVLAAVKVVMIHIRGVRREELIKSLMRKMAPPLVTLLSSPPEVQWVALRNINLLLQKRADILSNEMRVFFCKYNDPLYVKVEKLEIMVRLANDKNVDALLSELKEYASEVDVDFVRKSIKAIGQAAVKIDAAAERCVNVLLELIATRVSYVVQEAVVVMKVRPFQHIEQHKSQCNYQDIFRKYPSTYEGVIPTLCANLDELDEPEAKASLIWIIGEYADKIDNADELLGIFVDSFTEESYPVQLQTLTAVVKLFLKKPNSAQSVVQRVLTTATKDCDSPDVRDRAYIYWRLLSTDPGAAKAVVLAHRPPISIPRTTVPPALLEELLGEISSLASVYHKPEETFVGRGRVGADAVRKGTDDDRFLAQKAFQTVAAGQQAENLLDFDDAPAVEGELSGLAATQVFSQTPAAANLLAGTSSNPLDDLVSIFGGSGDSAAGFGFGGGNTAFAAAALSPVPATPSVLAPQTPAPLQQSNSQSQQEDLLGLF